MVHLLAENVALKHYNRSGSGCGRRCCGRRAHLPSAAVNDAPERGTQLMVPAGSVSQFNYGGFALRDEM